MPPRSGKGIVKSGNAGNSSKSSAKSPQLDTTSPEDKPLFPPGSKFPLSLLHERCQKNGWEKPIVDTRKLGDGWTFVVTLSRISKKNSERETVRFESHPPYTRPNALEARHWGATYALHRFCNGLQLNRVLPPGPREYWSELAVEQKAAPEHQKWMYDADPFSARKEVEERQARASQKRENEVAGPSRQGDSHKSSVSSEFSRAPEVRMASALRDLVEDTVKKANASYSLDDTTPSVLMKDDIPAVTQQLCLLDFKPTQIQNAIGYLSSPSPLGFNLLSTLTPLEACIEYLLLHIPEADLPRRFLPSNNSSNPFVVSGHSGADSLKKRWVEDLAIKEAGFPVHVVKECTADPNLVENLDMLIFALGCKLINHGPEDVFEPNADLEASWHKIRDNNDEVEALGAHFVSPCHIVMPLFSAPVQLHVLLPPETSSGRTMPATYVGSQSVAPYIRLHLLAQLLRAMKQDDFIEPCEGFLIAAMRALEDCWAHIETNGPPDMSAVVGHLVAPRTAPQRPDLLFDGPSDAEVNAPRRKPGHVRDDRSDEQVKQDFAAICRTKAYRDLLASRQRLPAFAAKDQFLDTLDKHRAAVIVGETGCGKTTQLPQFILDSLIHAGRGSRASIVITQPRRISAISVAARVSGERGDDGSVGYAIRGESKQDKRTKLLFCTTGVLLRRLGTGDNLENVTHVVVDEVHERSVDGDFLLLELRELLSKHKTLKVILMSATINHETFVKYFHNAPMLTIPGFAHPVTDKYLEDYIPLLSYVPAGTRRGGGKSTKDQEYEHKLKSQGLSEQNISSIQNIVGADRIDYQLISALVKYIISSASNPYGILIFLPGVQEIRQCIEAISSVIVDGEADVYPLHANLTNDEQRAIFKQSRKWKIIAATNVAETSITIDDVVYVIDGGKVKESNYNPETGMSVLAEQWVTRAASKQRRGRAGRTQPGVCYKLYTRKQEGNMKPFPVPEILRIPLESISLTVKVMRENEDVQHFLKKAIDPPDVSAMDKAWSVLQELGAIDNEGKLTALGRHMAMLPLDLRLGKMLVLGSIFRCLKPVLTVVASLSSKPLFVSPLDKREEATQAKLRFNRHNSDLLTDVEAYDECMRLRIDGKSQKTLRNFCEENFISANAVREITSLRQDFFSSLSDLGFIPISSTPDSPNLNVNSSNINLVKGVILGGLWPRVARVHLPSSAIKFDKVQAGTVQRENTAKEFKLYDLKNNRVFLHPSSVLFGESTWKSPFLAFFQLQQTTKVFLRGATEVPMYALLLFGGSVSVNHVGGGLVIGTGESTLRLRAWPRIGILVNQLRRLLEVQLQRCIEQGLMIGSEQDFLVSSAITALLEQDGLTSY